MNLNYLLISSFLFLTFCHHAPTTSTGPSTSPPPSGEKVTCSLHTDIRHLRILPVQNNGCDLHYTKYNTEKSVATSQSSKQHCVDISKRIITQLTQSGFACE